MKKKLVSAIAASLFLLILVCGCGDKKKTSAKFDFNREQIDSVIIEDSVKGYYEDELSIEMSVNELSVFMSIVPELEVRDGQSGQGSCCGSTYNVVCRNETGDALYTFTVDASHNLNMEDKHLWHNDALDQFFDDLEAKYGFKVTENRERTPGPGYFSLTDHIAKLEFSEYTETNFDEGVEYTCTAKEVEELRDGISHAALDEAPKPDTDKYLYRIYAFDKWGSTVYDIFVYEDFLVTINGRMVSYDSVKDWLLEMEKVSGYVRE